MPAIWRILVRSILTKAHVLSDPSVPFAPTSPFSGSVEASPKIIGLASTLKLTSKSDTSTCPGMEEFALPKGQHWVDRTEEGTIVVIDQPEGQTCAAIGGIMANRMQKKGVRGCVVGGRVRDLAELKSSGLPVSSNFLTCILPSCWILDWYGKLHDSHSTIGTSTCCYVTGLGADGC